MGMAASQARYLGLSARKTNIEFEGQQVNQQRTALANESAGLFRRMLSLDVPTAPSKLYPLSTNARTAPISYAPLAPPPSSTSPVIIEVLLSNAFIRLAECKFLCYNVKK